MKHYTHKPVELKKLTTQTINFKRFYETPDGQEIKKVYLSGEKKSVMRLQTMLQGYLQIVVLLSIICVKII